MELLPAAPQSRALLLCFALLASLVSGRACTAQQRALADLPESPTPQRQSTEAVVKPNSGAARTTYNILSRRSFFFPDLAYTPKPLNSVRKLLLATDVTIAPSSLIAAAASAAISQANDSWPGYGQGWEAYGKRYGATMALDASTNVFGVFLLPSVLHQDPRYFPLAHASFGRHVRHALRRVMVTPTDGGGQAPDISGLLGPLGAEGLSNTYLPNAERTTGKTFERYGVQMGILAAGNIVKEFWPAIFKTLRIGAIAPGAAPSPAADRP
jgi:hypothetical protein